MAFVPFWPEDGYRFCPPDYSLKSGMVFKGTTIAYEPGIFACNMFSVKYYYMIIQHAETIYWLLLGKVMVSKPIHLQSLKAGVNFRDEFGKWYVLVWKRVRLLQRTSWQTLNKNSVEYLLFCVKYYWHKNKSLLLCVLLSMSWKIQSECGIWK